MKRILLAALLLTACQQAPEGVPSTNADAANATTSATPEQTAETDSVAACTERGVAYFKEIGSYPTLSSAPNRGRSAREVAAERCGRTLTAF